MAATATPDTETEVSTDTMAEIDALFSAADDLYKVIVHDDDVTPFDTVVTALVQLFGHGPVEALKLTQQVDTTGRATVAVLPKEEAEAGVSGLHGRKIQASMEKASLGDA